MDNYILSSQDREIILKYLYTKPYQEVAAAIAVLVRLPKLDPKISPSFVKEDEKRKKTNGNGSYKDVEKTGNVLDITKLLKRKDEK